MSASVHTKLLNKTLSNGNGMTHKTVTHLTGLLLKNHDWWPGSKASSVLCGMPRILDLSIGGMNDVLETTLHCDPL